MACFVAGGRALRAPIREGGLFLLSDARGFTRRRGAGRCDGQELGVSVNMVVDTFLPLHEVPADHTTQSWLRELTRRGVEHRYGEGCGPAIVDRIEYELAVIEMREAVRYMLVVAEYVNWAKRQGIWVGPGRGSTAGSVVAYALGITEVDPIRHGLQFDRFLSPNVPAVPDIDIDVERERRHEVVAHIVDAYGATSVAGIADIATDPRAHAAGLLIADRPISEVVPVQPMPRTASSEWLRSVDVLSTLDYVESQKRGLVKFDVLGLKHLDTIRRTVDAVQRHQGVTIKPWSQDVPLDDPASLRLLGPEDAADLFQLGGAELRRLLRALQPARFEDLVAMLAIYRPDPIKRGLHTAFIARGHGRLAMDSVHPDVDANLASILDETRGLLIYQEQAVEVAHVFAGMSLPAAELLRRNLGNVADAAGRDFMRDFTSGVEGSGYSAAAAQALASWLLDGLPHAFNKSHAVSCALITYWCAYLKAHYPAEYDDAVRHSSRAGTVATQ